MLTCRELPHLVPLRCFWPHELHVAWRLVDPIDRRRVDLENPFARRCVLSQDPASTYEPAAIRERR